MLNNTLCSPDMNTDRWVDLYVQLDWIADHKSIFGGKHVTILDWSDLDKKLEDYLELKQMVMQAVNRDSVSPVWEDSISCNR